MLSLNLLNLLFYILIYLLKLMLKGLKVLEFEGLAPSVFCGMYFADQGAQVILIARPEPAPFSMEIHKNIMNRNKKCVALSLKNTDDKIVIHQLIKNSDIIIDPYRPGVLQKQGFGPNDLYLINTQVILLRVTGYGQSGQMALKPGHDLNYISSSGILKLINDQNHRIQFPANYLADFVSASLGIVGTLKALSNRKILDSGSVVDCSLAGGCSYLTRIVKNNKNINQTQKNLIEYFQVNGKRYIVTHNVQIDETEKNKIRAQIEIMQKRNSVFLKKEQYEIAEIKKIEKIARSKLPNPFGLENLQISPNIPERNAHRQQILQVLQLQNLIKKPKL